MSAPLPFPWSHLQKLSQEYNAVLTPENVPWVPSAATTSVQAPPNVYGPLSYHRQKYCRRSSPNFFLVAVLHGCERVATQRRERGREGDGRKTFFSGVSRELWEREMIADSRVMLLPLLFYPLTPNSKKNPREKGAA